MKTKYALFLVFLLFPALVLAGCSAPSLSAIQKLVSQPAGQAAQAPAATTQQSAPAAANVQPAAAVTQAQSAAPSSSTLTSDSVLEALQSNLSQIYIQVNPSVVSLTVDVSASSGSSDFPQFPGLPDSTTPHQAYASGFVWDTQGHIVTNNHVVKSASNIKVVFADNTTASATVVGTDANSDLAVIKVDVPADQLHPVQVADSTLLKVGDLVVAIGNPFGDLGGTMTVGFVSALGRSLPVSSAGSSTGSSFTIPDIIQTDAAINPGNSGGVLLNEVGQLVGVPTAIESQVGQNSGIGFAVPSFIVQKVVPQLISNGKVEHPWIGIMGTTLTTELAKAMGLSEKQQGALVIAVASGGPAEKAGLEASTQQVQIDGQTAQVGGDVIVAINGQTIATFDDVVSYLSRNTNVGDKITLTVLRDGKEQTVELTLAARPASLPSQDQTQGQTQPPSGTGTGAWLGIQGMTMSSDIAQAMNLGQDQAGVLVVQVVSGSPAEAAGLRASLMSVTINGQEVKVGGDVIVAADDQPIISLEDLQSYLGQAEPGQQVTLTLLRSGQQISVDVTLGERPSSNQ